jgi:hypothetical protein
MDKFIDLMKSSVITQALITMLVLGATVALILRQIPVPQQLYDIDFAVVAFYMGSKVGLSQGIAASQITK